MPWTQQFSGFIAPGAIGGNVTVTELGQRFMFVFPDLAFGRVLLFGVGLWRNVPGLPAPQVPVLMASRQVWHNPERWIPSSAELGGAVSFYVPKTFGSNLSVAILRFDS